MFFLISHLLKIPIIPIYLTFFTSHKEKKSSISEKRKVVLGSLEYIREDVVVRKSKYSRNHKCPSTSIVLTPPQDGGPQDLKRF